MRIEKCWLCSSSIYPGHGTVFVRNDGKMFRFCRSKCHKHFKAKHNPRKMAWTKEFRKIRGKEMVIDSTFNFEKRRDCPIRYNRDLMIKTIQAIKKIDEIKNRRQDSFYRNRIYNAFEKEHTLVEKEVERHHTLLNGPLGKEQTMNMDLVKLEPMEDIEPVETIYDKLKTKVSKKSKIENKLDTLYKKEKKKIQS